MGIGAIGKYERLDVLGHGSSGVVYLAWDGLLRRQVALKEIRADGPETERVLEEARVLERLRDHPNIVRVHSVDYENGVILIDMELVRGRNLARLLHEQNGQPLPIRDAVYITRAVLGALDYAHTRRIIHRDIKPANVLIGDDYGATPDFTVKLTDFGLAEALGTGSVAGGGGTYPYMAPEDFAEDASSDYRSDLWAVGAVLYEMLTGQRPFAVERARDPFSWRKAIAEIEPPRPSQINPALPRALDEVLARALAKEKANRYPTAAVFADALQAATSGIRAEPAPPRHREKFPVTTPENSPIDEREVPDPIRIPASRPELPPGAAEDMATVPAPNRGRVAVMEREAAALPAAAQEPARPAEPARRSGKAKPGKATVEAAQEAERLRWWFVPLFLLCLAPPVAALWKLTNHPGQFAGGGFVAFMGVWTVSGFLSALLLLVSVGARIPVLARALCFIPLALGVGAAGILAYGILQQGVTTTELVLLSLGLFLPLFTLLLAASTLGRGGWKAWSVILLLLASLVTGLILGA